MTIATQHERDAEIRDANTYMAFGAGLGVLGTGAALLAGATCPLCVVIAPAMFGVGAWRRIAAQHGGGNDSSACSSTPENSQRLP